MNKREDFRANMFGLKCVVHDDIKSVVGEIENLSGTGMAIILAADFFVDRMFVEFMLGEKKFDKEAIIVNRREMESGHTKYHLKMMNQTEKQREELHSSLVTLEAGRNNEK